MATKLTAGKKIVREINIRGIDSPIIATMTSEGIELRVAGTKRSIEIAWELMPEVGLVPDNAPSFLRDFPLHFLQYYATKKARP